MTTRRAFLAAGASLGLGASVASARIGRSIDPISAEALEADIRRYDAFGVHRTGSAADHATSRWLRTHLRQLGYTVVQQPFETTLFEPTVHQVLIGNRALPVFPQEPFAAENLRLGGMLRPLGDGKDVAGKIAFVRFPYGRDASLSNAPYAGLAKLAAAHNALALLAITEGPTGEIIVFNTPSDSATTPLPILLVAPRDAGPIVADAEAVIEIKGRRAAVTAVNTIGRLDRGTPRIVVSTPQSGWTHAAGERGPGIALWRALATIAAARGMTASFAFVATSGHEIAHAGLTTAMRNLEFLRQEPLAMWIHLGANLATYDYERDTDSFRLLRTANPDRAGGASAEILERVRKAFAAVPSFPIVDSSTAKAFGEARQILAAGYQPVVGLVGSGILHHVARDRTPIATSGELLAPLAMALARLLRSLG